jgi:metal-responsive CopG/Arc/MetJ family transcriptional regulator
MPDPEKITINISAVDLGKIDLLVHESLYSNRTDFIRTAIRNQLDHHNLEIQQTVVRHSFVVGVLSYTKADFEKARAKSEKIKIILIGILNLSDDITPELACDVIESIQLRGVMHAKDELKAALSDRMI